MMSAMLLIAAVSYFIWEISVEATYKLDCQLIDQSGRADAFTATNWPIRVKWQIQSLPKFTCYAEWQCAKIAHVCDLVSLEIADVSYFSGIIYGVGWVTSSKHVRTSPNHPCTHFGAWTQNGCQCKWVRVGRPVSMQPSMRAVIGGSPSHMALKKSSRKCPSGPLGTPSRVGWQPGVTGRGSSGCQTSAGDTIPTAWATSSGTLYPIFTISCFHVPPGSEGDAKWLFGCLRYVDKLFCCPSTSQLGLWLTRMPFVDIISDYALLLLEILLFYVTFHNQQWILNSCWELSCIYMIWICLDWDGPAGKSEATSKSDLESEPRFQFGLQVCSVQHFVHCGKLNILLCTRPQRTRV